MKIVFKDFIHLNDNEIKDILELRNQKNIREHMKDSKIITIKKHFDFINSLKDSIDRKYFAIFNENRLLGSLNFIKNEELSWGLYFKDTSSPILKSVSTYIFLEFIFKQFDNDINSSVKKNNVQALNFNKSFGFDIFKENNEYFYLILSKQTWGNHKNSKLIKPIKKYLDKIDYEFN